MKTRKVLKPGQPGTKKWLEKYGDRLFCVRYRYDKNSGQRMTTIELIVAKGILKGNNRGIANNKILPLRVNFEEMHLRKLVKEAGGRWNAQKKVWELPYIDIINLGLQTRIVRSEKRG